jgi:hypothetical protein
MYVFQAAGSGWVTGNHADDRINWLEEATSHRERPVFRTFRD